MDAERFDVARVTTCWITEAEDALEVADHLIDKADYSYAPFSDIIEARYPDMRRAFRQKCTPEYTQCQMAMSKELFGWLRSHLP
jgi:hypothetical protein